MKVKEIVCRVQGNFWRARRRVKSPRTKMRCKSNAVILKLNNCYSIYVKFRPEYQLKKTRLKNHSKRVKITLKRLKTINIFLKKKCDTFSRRVKKCTGCVRKNYTIFNF